MLYGTDDHLQCLAALPGGASANGGVSCIGFKYSVEWAGVPWSVHDDGYVLTTPGGTRYVPVDAARLEALQAEGLVARPAPAYEVPVGWRVAGYSGYAVLALIVIAVVVKTLLRRRLARARATVEPPAGGPVLARRRDREIAAVLSEYLEAGEQVRQQALAYDRKPDSITSSMAGLEFLAAITDRRILLTSSKIGLFGKFKGSRTSSTIAFSEISAVDATHESLVVHTAERVWPLVVPMVASGVTASNQQAFLVALPRLKVELPRARVEVSPGRRGGP